LVFSSISSPCLFFSFSISFSYDMNYSIVPETTKWQINVLQEVDEENIEDSPTTQSSVGAASKSELDINSKFDEFWRAGREKAKEKKHRRAKDFRTSESDAPNAPACTTTSTVITPAPSVTTSAPRNNSSSNNNNTQTPSL
jgi:hypothetical protein